jgi:hypothetical protein
MKHPDPKCQEAQDEFLRSCPPEDREFHARVFRYGNAACWYHQLANTPRNEDSLKLYFEEWLEGLPANIAADMKERGLEYCKSVISFTRYVNERTDIGLEEWMQTHLSEEDYNAFKKANENK